MTEKREGQALALPPKKNTAKLGHIKQIAKVMAYFRYNVGTSLDCARATGILRNSITYYIVELELLGLLRAISRRADSTTGYPAKHYSADPDMWNDVTKEPQHTMDVEKGGAL